MNKFMQIQLLIPSILSHHIYMESITILPNTVTKDKFYMLYCYLAFYSHFLGRVFLCRAVVSPKV